MAATPKRFRHFVDIFDFLTNIGNSQGSILEGFSPTKKSPTPIWVFPKIGVPQNGWLKMENPIKMDDLGVPLFSETPI